MLQSLVRWESFSCGWLSRSKLRQQLLRVLQARFQFFDGGLEAAVQDVRDSGAVFFL